MQNPRETFYSICASDTHVGKATGNPQSPFHASLLLVKHITPTKSEVIARGHFLKSGTNTLTAEFSTNQRPKALKISAKNHILFYATGSEEDILEKWQRLEQEAKCISDLSLTFSKNNQCQSARKYILQQSGFVHAQVQPNAPEGDLMKMQFS